MVKLNTLRFQSTHPLRGATGTGGGSQCRRDISIHAPLAGCDHLERAGENSWMRFQSTHPLRGATTFGSSRSMMIANFNPRTPCGVRRGAAGNGMGGREFQSTHPLRGATDFVRLNYKTGKFQSTHPLRGATIPPLRQIPCTLHFNPRTPCGVRLQRINRIERTFKFQSTHPLRGATNLGF